MFHGPETAIVSQLVSSQFSLIEDDGGLGEKGGRLRGTNRRRSRSTNVDVTHVISLSLSR